jgi:hypothetical protein
VVQFMLLQCYLATTIAPFKSVIQVIVIIISRDLEFRCLPFVISVISGVRSYGLAAV